MNPGVLSFEITGAANREQAWAEARKVAAAYFDPHEHQVHELSAEANGDRVQIANGTMVAETIRFDVKFEAEMGDGSDD